MSDSIEMTSCIRHRENTRYFVYYEDLQDLSLECPDKVAAFLRVLEVKTNKKIAAYAVLLEEAINNNQPIPQLSLWLEVSYNDFVYWSLNTLGRSSFQIADKKAEEKLFVKSRVLTRPIRPDDPESPKVPYKEYILVRENVQAAIDKQEASITGEKYETYGNIPPIIENIPLLKKTWGMLQKTRGDMLKKTRPPVEKNRLINKDKSNLSKESNKESITAPESSTSNTSPNGDSTLLAEIMKRLEAMERENQAIRENNQSLQAENTTLKAQVEKLSPKAEQEEQKEESEQISCSQGTTSQVTTGKTGINEEKQQEPTIQEQSPKRQSRQAKSKSEIVGSPEARAIAEMYRSIFKKPVPLTQKMIEEAEKLVPCSPTQEDINNVRLWCYASNPDWYGSNGRTQGRVTLKDIVDNWAGWVASQEAPTTGFQIPDELKDRVTGVYAALNEWRASKTGDAENVFVPDAESDQAVCHLLQKGRRPTKKRMNAVCDLIWETPRNVKTGYLLREHMSVKMICQIYRERELDLAAKEQEANMVNLDPDRVIGGLKYFSNVFTSSTLVAAGSK